MRQKVLVIDDEPHIVNFLRLFFEKEYDVFEANTGLEGISLAQKLQPDLILLDTQMPKMNGYVTSMHLKGNPLTRHIPIIFLAAMIRTSERPQMLRSKVEDIIAKPFDPYILRHKMHKVLGGGVSYAYEYIR